MEAAIGISFLSRFCYFPPARTGSHSIHAALTGCAGTDYVPMGQCQRLVQFPDTENNDYIELNGDHTRAIMVHRRIPETREFRSASTFREPLSRVASIYSFTSSRVGNPQSLEGFDKWIRFVFCNRYNTIWRAHGLQTELFSDEFGQPCVDRIYSISRISELVAFLQPERDAYVPHVNQSYPKYSVADLEPSTQKMLLEYIAPDMEFWKILESNDGLVIT